MTLALLNQAVCDVMTVTAKMRNKDNNNAYRLLSSDDGDDLHIPILAYKLILGTHVLQLADWKGEVREAAMDFEDAWEELLDVVGQRIREAHEDLEDARSCFNDVNELLQSHLGSDNIGADPDKTAKGAIRRFEAAIGSLSVAMREELVGGEPTISGTEQKNNIRFLALSLIKGLVHHFNWSQAEAVSAVHARLWQEFKKVGLKCGEENFRQLQYKGKVTDAPYADIEKLREYNLIK